MHRQANDIIMLITLIVGLIFPVLLLAQLTFERTYGGTGDDWGYCIRQTSDGGYIVVGGTSSFGAGQYDVYLIKTNADGDTLWTHTYGDMDWDWGYCVKQTSDHGYIIVGMTRSFGAGQDDIYLIKTDSNGDTLWTRTYGGTNIDWGYSVQQTSDGGYIIAGATKSFGEGLDWDVYLIKTDANGNALWTRTYGSTNNSELGRSVQQTSDGGYIIAGHTSTTDNDRDVYLLKTDANGDTLWTRTYGSADFDRGYSVQQTFDQGFIIAGYTWSWDPGYGYIFLIKTDVNGDTLWTRSYGRAGADEGYCVQQTSDSGYVIIGITELFGTSNLNIYLIKTNAYGDTLWTRTYGGTEWDGGRSVQQTSDGGYIIAGTTSSYGAGGADVYLIKTDADGLVTGIEEEYFENVPDRFFIAQNFPNPFNSETQIEFALPKEAHVNLEVYDVTGRIAKTLVDRKMGAGYHSVKWPAKDVPSGIYFYKIKTENYTETKKIIVVK
jgi:hypothetical protein